MKAIAATQLRRHCGPILDHLDDAGVLVTKRGRAVARLTPIRSDSAELIGSLQHKLRIRGDLLSTGARWELMR